MNMSLVQKITRAVFFTPKSKLVYTIQKVRNKHMNRFSVDGNWLHLDGQPVTEVKSPVNKTSAGKNICDFIILHYTASTSMTSAVNQFKDPETKVSWHLTVDEEGRICQLYDFRKITWHAGKSGWKTKTKEYDEMNPFSIGIEMINAGPLSYKNGIYTAWSGQHIPQSRVWFDDSGNPWHKFTEIQIQTVYAICSALAKKYNCLDILGHNQI